MTEGSMTGRPYGGANDPSAEEGLPGERPLDPEEQQVTADPDQSPRAAQGGMSDDVTRRPGDPPDATGPQG